MKGSPKYIINKNLKIGEIQSFCRGKSSKNVSFMERHKIL